MIPSKMNLNYMLMNVKKNTLITTWSYIMCNLSRIRWRWPRPNFHHLTLNAIHCSLHEFLLYDNIYVRICDYAAHEHGFISNLHIQAHVGLNPISKSNKNTGILSSPSCIPSPVLCRFTSKCSYHGLQMEKCNVPLWPAEDPHIWMSN